MPGHFIPHLRKAFLPPALMLLFFACAAWADSPIMPDPSKTPGDALTADTSVVCQKGYTKTVRDVPEPLKNQIYRSYGITDHKPGEYEIDHLISLELGGSNSARNLWPQSYETRPLNAHVKDKLENQMHKLICEGKLDITQAQVEIAKNWIGAYAKYIRPVPSGEATTTHTDPTGGCPDNMPVKGSSSGIYHVPGGSYYNRTTHPKACFATAADAEAAGYRAAKQ